MLPQFKPSLYLESYGNETIGAASYSSDGHNIIVARNIPDVVRWSDNEDANTRGNGRAFRNGPDVTPLDTDQNTADSRPDGVQSFWADEHDNSASVTLSESPLTLVNNVNHIALTRINGDNPVSRVELVVPKDTQTLILPGGDSVVVVEVPSIYIRDMKTGDIIKTIQCPCAAADIVLLANSPDGKYLLMASKQSLFKIRISDMMVSQYHLNGYPDAISTSSDMFVLAEAHDPGVEFIGGSFASDVTRRLTHVIPGVLSICVLSPDNDLIAVGGYKGVLSIVDVKTGEIESVVDFSNVPVMSKGGGLGEMDDRTHYFVSPGARGISALCFAPNGHDLFVGTFAGYAVVLDTRLHHILAVPGLEVSPNYITWTTTATDKHHFRLH